MRRFTPILVLLLLFTGARPVDAAGIVGDGTPESCDTAALVAAVAGGGLVTFDCGGAHVIVLDETLSISQSTTIDGGGAITLDANHSRRHINHSGGVLTLRGLTIANGYVEGADAAAKGGSIHSQGAGQTLIAENVTFRENSAVLLSFTGNAYNYGGGAIFIQGGHLTISDSAFTENTAPNGAGGAIHVLRSNVTISSSVFTANSAQGAGQGGAIYIDGPQPNGEIRISGSSFSANSAHNQGGAIYVHLYQGNDLFHVNESSFVGNAVTGGDIGLGGAISGGNGRVTILNSLFADNRVARPDGDEEVGFLDGSGGAVALAENASIIIANTTFTGNRAEGTSTSANGGALYIANNTQQFRIINSTIAHNYAGWTGGGISSTVNGILRNSIIAHNTADNPWEIQQQCSARVNTGGSNIQYPDRNPNPDFVNEVVCVLGILIADPLLLPLADNGGPTQTLAPQFGSPVIDLGNNTICAAPPVSARDQRGRERPSDGNGNGTRTCDIGAFEYYVDIPPFAPVLLSPPNGANITTLTPSFNWQPAPFADAYHIQIDQVGDFVDPLIETATQNNAYHVPLLLPGIYYWRILSTNDNGITISQPRSLTIVSEPGAAPDHNLHTETNTPSLAWGPLSWAAGYHVQVAKDSSFAPAALLYDDATLPASTLAITPAALPNGIYYWRVRAQRANGNWGNWSPTDSFIILYYPD